MVGLEGRGGRVERSIDAFEFAPPSTTCSDEGSSCDDEESLAAAWEVGEALTVLEEIAAAEEGRGRKEGGGVVRDATRSRSSLGCGRRRLEAKQRVSFHSGRRKLGSARMNEMTHWANRGREGRRRKRHALADRELRCRLPVDATDLSTETRPLQPTHRVRSTERDQGSHVKKTYESGMKNWFGNGEDDDSREVLQQGDSSLVEESLGIWSPKLLHDVVDDLDL